MSGRRRAGRVETTDDWQQLKLLARWPEQARYELIQPIVLFDLPPSERARQTGDASERTLYRRVARFEAEGMASLFDPETSRRRRLPPSLRRLIVDLKAEHPALSLGEIANVCYVRSGRRPSKHTVKRVLAEEPLPLRMVRRFEPYHETEDPKERRLAVVRLHSEGWAPRSIAAYLGAHRSTVYRVLRRWVEEGIDGLEDRLHGRPPGVRKVDLKTIEAVRRLQNPNLGAFRVHAALAQMGVHLSPATAGSTGWRSPRDLRGPRARCRSPRAGATSSGRRTSATETTAWAGDKRTSSRCWKTTAARSWRAASSEARTLRPSCPCSTGRWTGTARPRRW